MNPEEFSDSASSQSISAAPGPRRNAGRWLAFLPSVLLFVIASHTVGSSGNGTLYFHDELLAAGFIAAFLALLWVTSRAVAAGPRTRLPTHPNDRGFDVLPRESSK